MARPPKPGKLPKALRDSRNGGLTKPPQPPNLRGQLTGELVDPRGTKQQQICKLAVEGLTMEEIAQQVGVSRSYVTRAVVTNREAVEAMKSARLDRAIVRESALTERLDEVITEASAREIPALINANLSIIASAGGNAPQRVTIDLRSAELAELGLARTGFGSATIPSLIIDV